MARAPAAVRYSRPTTRGTRRSRSCRSARWSDRVHRVGSIGSNIDLHPDFGSDLHYGIPYAVVPAGQPRVAVHFTAYGDQSDKGPYPIPAGAPVEGGADATGDRHVIVLQARRCRLYELFDAHPNADGSWNAASGAVFNLRSNRLRPDGWTSADAAGLPIFAGLIRYDEIQRGYINHAIRFTAPQTQAGFIHPATHYASDSTDPDLPPMGLRLRLRASFDISRFPRVARIILRAMKVYGLILADNGSPWYFQGATDPRWDDDALNSLKTVPGSAFQVVQSGPILHAPADGAGPRRAQENRAAQPKIAARCASRSDSCGAC